MKSIADILNVFSNNKWKILALVLLLVSTNVGTYIKVYYTAADCSPLIKQNSELVKSQSSLTTQNTELLAGYIQIQNLLKDIKQDTIYVNSEKTILRNTTIRTDAEKIELKQNHIDSTISTPMDEEVLKSSAFCPPITIKDETPIVLTSTKTRQSEGNKKEVMGKIQDIINKKSKK